MTKNVDRKYLRARSEEFVKSIVEMSKRKEEPAKPQEPIKDVGKIEGLAKVLKDKDAEKPRKYWEKPVKTEDSTKRHRKRRR